MSTAVQIYNLALGKLGDGTVVAAVNEDTNQAIAITRVYAQCVDRLLREFNWPFAKAYADLDLKDGTASEPVNNDWTYSYELPDDCLFPRRIVVNRTTTDRIPFEEGRDDDGTRVIFTDWEDPNLEYTRRPMTSDMSPVLDTAAFDADAIDALAWLIAFEVAPQLSKAEGMRDTCFKGYQYGLSVARFRAHSGKQPDPPADSEWIRAMQG